jgi:hypothetical protein
MQRTNAQAHGKATGTAHCRAPHLRVGPGGASHGRALLLCCCTAGCLLAVAQLTRAVAGWERRTVRGAAGLSGLSGFPLTVALQCTLRAAALCSGAVAH